MEQSISNFFDIYYDKEIPNKLAICIIPKIKNITNLVISELLNEHKKKFNPKIHLYIACDISSSMKKKISNIPLESIIYNDRKIKIPSKISQTRNAIGFAATTLLSHILQNEITKCDLTANIHIIPFENDINSYISYTNISQENDIDYKIFEHLTNIINKKSGTYVGKALTKINNLIKCEDENDIKLVFIFTDGDFSDENLAKNEYEKLLTNKNTATACIFMGKQCNDNQEKSIRNFNINNYFYIADFISDSKENILDIIPHVFYNLLNYVFLDKNIHDITTNITTISLNVKNDFNNYKKFKMQEKKTRLVIINKYDDFERIINDNNELIIWNVELCSEDVLVEKECDICEYIKSCFDNYSSCNDDLWDNFLFSKEIIYPINDIQKSYVNNCMTPIYALISYDINTKINFVINDKYKLSININNIVSNIDIAKKLELISKSKMIKKLYEQNIFSYLTNIKNLTKYNKKNNDLCIKLFSEIKKINDNFNKHLSNLSSFKNINEKNLNTIHEKYINMILLEQIDTSIEFIKNKKYELFNSRNNSKLYTTSSIRNASTYKSLIALKNQSEQILKHTNDSILCKICMSNISNMCNMYCGHIVTCDNPSCLEYVEGIDKCIVCRESSRKIPGIVKILLDDYEYNCVSCFATNESNNSNYLFDCGHVGFCDNCTKNNDQKIFDCHRCKKKVKILCKIYV